MQCRSCSAEIAEKAIVCYRCGTPTADHGATSSTKTGGGGRRWWPAGLLVVVILAVAAYVLLTR